MTILKTGSRRPPSKWQCRNIDRWRRASGRGTATSRAADGSASTCLGDAPEGSGAGGHRRRLRPVVHPSCPNRSKMAWRLRGRSGRRLIDASRSDGTHFEIGISIVAKRPARHIIVPDVQDGSVCRRDAPHHVQFHLVDVIAVAIDRLDAEPCEKIIGWTWNEVVVTLQDFRLRSTVRIGSRPGSGTLGFRGSLSKSGYSLLSADKGCLGRHIAVRFFDNRSPAI